MKRLLTLFILFAMAALQSLAAQEVLPGICVNSRQPVQVYLNGSLVCENSLNCVMVNLRPLALYQVEVRRANDPKAEPLFNDRVKAPEKGIQAVVVRGEEPAPAPSTQAPSPAKEANAPSAMATPASSPMDAPNRAKAIITEDRFEEFMVVLDKATPEQAHLLIEARTTQNNFMVKHVKQIIEMYVPGDQSRVALIKKMYSSIADRENAFQLINSVGASDAKQELSEFIAKYNATHPL